MTSVLDVAAAIGIIVVASLFILHFFDELREIKQQQDAEVKLAELMVQDEVLRNRLFDYMEAVDRDGERLASGQADALARAIAERLAAEHERGNRYVLDALSRSSPVERVRYIGKLADEASREIDEHGDLSASHQDERVLR